MRDLTLNGPAMKLYPLHIKPIIVQIYKEKYIQKYKY